MPECIAGSVTPVKDFFPFYANFLNFANLPLSSAPGEKIHAAFIFSPLKSRFPLISTISPMKKLLSIALAAAAVTVTAAEARAKTCKIYVVGGSWAGRSFSLQMENGKFVGTSGVSPSNLPRCVAKKYVYGRWYHLCKGGRLVVFKQKNNKWKPVSAKGLKKYKHDCL